LITLSVLLSVYRYRYLVIEHGNSKEKSQCHWNNSKQRYHISSSTCLIKYSRSCTSISIEFPGNVWIIYSVIAQLRCVWVIATCREREFAPFLSLLYVFLIFSSARVPAKRAVVRPFAVCFRKIIPRPFRSRERSGEASKALITGNYMYAGPVFSAVPLADPERNSWNALHHPALSLRSSRGDVRANVPHGRAS